MALDEHALSAPAPTALVEPRPAYAFARRVVRELAIQDWVVLAYCAALVLLVAGAAPSPARNDVLYRVSRLAAGTALAITLVRGGLIANRWLVALVYRVGLFGGVLGSYFLLRELLPVVNRATLDAELFALDLRVFGFEPAVWFDRFVTPATTEWFAFFYFFYFLVLAAHVLPLVFASRRAWLLAEFSLGMILVYTTAHLLYMAVPGFGPVKHLAPMFQHALPDGTWMRAVLSTVDAHGAQKDIFPSLHTGGPVFITLFSFRHRREAPFRFTWPLVAFFTLNIVGATMFLRWHYLIDVLAGATLATAGTQIAARIVGRERERRTRAGLSPVWTTFFDAAG